MLTARPGWFQFSLDASQSTVNDRLSTCQSIN